MPSPRVQLIGRCVLEAQRARNGWVVWALSQAGDTLGSLSLSDGQVERMLEAGEPVSGQSLDLLPTDGLVEVSLQHRPAGSVHKSELRRVLEA